MQDIYVLVDTNSPELYTDCGSANVHNQAYKTLEGAQKALKRYIETDGETYGEYKALEHDDDYAIFYLHGDENNICWFETRIQRISIQ